MKKKIHPKYFDNVKVTCACGNEFTTSSTLKSIRVEICSSCHPFFTGKQKLIDTAGRIDRFKKKYNIKDDTEKTPKRKLVDTVDATTIQEPETEKK